MRTRSAAEADEAEDVDQPEVEEGGVVAGLEVADVLGRDEPGLRAVVHHGAEDGRVALGAAEDLAAVVGRVGAGDAVARDEVLEERGDVGLGEGRDLDLAERGEERPERRGAGDGSDGADDGGAALELAQEEALGGAGAVERVEGEEEAGRAPAAREVGERVEDGALALVERAEDLLDLGPLVLGAGPGAQRGRDAGEGEDAELVEGAGERVDEAAHGARPRGRRRG